MVLRTVAAPLLAISTDLWATSADSIASLDISSMAWVISLMALLAIVASGITSLFDLSVTHPGTGEVIKPVNLFSVSGLHYILTSMVGNYTGFAPLGTVLVAMLGIGIAEGSGLIGAVLRILVLSAPRRLLTYVIVLAGVLSNTASEIGYVLLVPLAGMIFLAAGRHPIAGLAAAFQPVAYTRSRGVRGDARV